MLLSIIIPVYNERPTLGPVPQRSLSPCRGLVDDCSNDGTREWLKANFPEGQCCGSAVALDDDGNLIFVQEGGHHYSSDLRPMQPTKGWRAKDRIRGV